MGIKHVERDVLIMLVIIGISLYVLSFSTQVEMGSREQDFVRDFLMSFQSLPLSLKFETTASMWLLPVSRKPLGNMCTYSVSNLIIFDQFHWKNMQICYKIYLVNHEQDTQVLLND